MLIALVGAALLVLAWLYAVFVRGEHRVERPGGHWSVESIRYPDSHVSCVLYYADGRRRARVPSSFINTDTTAMIAWSTALLKRIANRCSSRAGRESPMPLVPAGSGCSSPTACAHPIQSLRRLHEK